ncbi:hypothetical protein QYF36_023992 [Acer negundo]|nr:hypothetical protein QYF36_023992 [Acer negundo]
MEFLKSTFVIGFLLLLFSAALSLAEPKIRQHDFVIQATPVKRLCKTHNSITVNGMFPGPTLEVNNGDTLVVKVTNKARYNVTIHWHGVRQMRTAWADGPEFVTQCPIRPGASYTYREGSSYPFPKPNRETPILLGEWWDANPIDVVRQATRTGAAPNVSDAYTINGQPGDLYNCSSKDTVIVPIDSGETHLLRVINSGLNQPLFFTIANHQFTVVGADASYLKPFTNSVIMMGCHQIRRGQSRGVANALSLGCPHHLGSGHGFPGGEWSRRTAISANTATGFTSMLRSPPLSS